MKGILCCLMMVLIMFQAQAADGTAKKGTAKTAVKKEAKTAKVYKRSKKKRAKKEKYAKKFTEESHALGGYTTWYQGYRTASGELYDKYKFTAAHRTLPFGTIVKVTNENTGKSIYVRVNDRGPWVRKFYIDLSYSAFKAVRGSDRDVVKTSAVVLSDENAKEIWENQFNGSGEEEKEAAGGNIENNVGEEAGNSETVLEIPAEKFTMLELKHKENMRTE